MIDKERVKEQLITKYELPFWIFLMLISVLLLALVGWLVSVGDARLANERLSVIEDAQQSEITDSVVTGGLSGTWEWVASHMLMWLYHGRVVLAFCLFVIFAIHGFKVVGR